MSKLMSLKNFYLCSSIILLSGCSTLTSEDISIEPGQENFNIPPPPEAQNVDILSLYSTYYYKPFAKYNSAGIPIRDKDGNPISDKISKYAYCSGSIEGVIGAPVNGVIKTFTYAGVRNDSDPNNIDCLSVLKKINERDKETLAKAGKQYYRVTVEEFGFGVNGWRLVPYRTIAIDNKFTPRIRYGSVIYIKDATKKVVKLTNGVYVYHDGYFIAGDTGGLIKGNHIDLFCGNEPGCLTDITNKKPFTAQIITDPIIVERLKSGLIIKK